MFFFTGSLAAGEIAINVTFMLASCVYFLSSQTPPILLTVGVHSEDAIVFNAPATSRALKLLIKVQRALLQQQFEWKFIVLL